MIRAVDLSRPWKSPGMPLEVHAFPQTLGKRATFPTDPPRLLRSYGQEIRKSVTYVLT